MRTTHTRATHARARQTRAHRILPVLCALTALPALAIAPAGAIAQETSATDAPGMAFVSGRPDQPVGMDEADIKSFLATDLGRPLGTWKQYEFLWKQGFLFMTPRHTQPLADVFLAKHEVTNAQWRHFLSAPINQDEGTTENGVRLVDLAEGIWGISTEDGGAMQRAWTYLYERNKDVLDPVLNPDGVADFDPIVAQAGEKSLPAGLTIQFSVLQPPPYWIGGVPPDDELDRPVRFVSWADARKFCRWAGMHLPLEVEWEAGARGTDADRRFTWGDEWNADAIVWKGTSDPAPSRPESVTSRQDFATPDGLEHMLGNVSEFVYDLARTYPGSKSEFKFGGAGVLTRGGSYYDDDYVMLAADRAWDVGARQIDPKDRADTYGFRYAAYASHAREICLDLATYGQETTRRECASNWFPYPLGLTEREREKADRRRVLQGFALERAAGWLQRDMDVAADNHAHVRGPAKGIAFLPIKGIESGELKNAEALARISTDAEATAFIGALLSTQNCWIDVTDESGENSRRLHLGSAEEFTAPHDLGFEYQIGAWLVLRGTRVAVYPGSGVDRGVFGTHLKGAPLGYLPAPWTAEWKPLAESASEAVMHRSVATFTAPIPQLDKKTGTLKKKASAAVLTIRVPVAEFAAE